MKPFNSSESRSTGYTNDTHVTSAIDPIIHHTVERL